MTRTRRPRSGLFAVTAGAVLALLAGCDAAGVASDPGGKDDSGHPLVRADDLGRGYRDDPAPGKDDDLTRAGCLSALELFGSGASRRSTVTFATDNPFRSPIVKHTVLEFGDADGAGRALARWHDTAAACDAVRFAQDDAVLRLDVTTDTDRHGKAVTEEVNLIATGEVDSGSVDIGVSQWASVARVRDHLSVVHVLDFNHRDAVEEGRRIARLTADRLERWADDPGHR